MKQKESKDAPKIFNHFTFTQQHPFIDPSRFPKSISGDIVVILASKAEKSLIFLESEQFLNANFVQYESNIKLKLYLHYTYMKVVYKAGT